MSGQVTEEVVRSSRPAVLLPNAAAVLVLLAALALQWHAGSVLFGSSVQGDAAKHYTSGVLVFDYLREGLGSRPVSFAESFEVRYPLVGIGQWPPMYYAIQGLFYFLAGPFIRSAQALSALTAAILAFVVFVILRRRTGSRIALLGAAVFLATPLIQSAAWEVMSDLLTGFFVFLAIIAFARLLDRPGDWKAAVAFVAYAIASVLSKGSAWALGPFFLLAPLLCRRNRFFASRWFLGPLLVVVLSGSVFYLVAARTGIGYPIHFSHYLGVGLGHRFSTLRQVLAFAPGILITTSIAGAIVAFRARWRLGDESFSQTLSLAAAAWVLSQLLFLFILPMTPEPRVLTPALAPVAVLTACLMQWLEAAFGAITPALAGAIIVASCIGNPISRVDGFRDAANRMPYPADGALIMVAANDWGGEEEIITERLSHDRSHRDVILRGTHVLADVDAARKDQPLFTSAEAVRTYLLQMPVRFIVLGSPPYDFAFLPLLDKAVTDDPKDFHLIAQVPLVAEPSGKPIGALRIFENPAGRNHHPAIVQTRLGSYARRRILEYHWK